MATISTRMSPIMARLPRRIYSPLSHTAQQRWQSSYSHLKEEMTARKIRPIIDDMSPQASFRLDVSFADFLPGAVAPHHPPSPLRPIVLPIPHHLLYFEPAKPPSSLLHDGTNPDQSPGEPFVRRMWAGGTVLYNNASPLHLDNTRGVCIEAIRDVTVKGQEGSEKVFVGVERRLATLMPEEDEGISDAMKLLEIQNKSKAASSADGSSNGASSGQEIKHRDAEARMLEIEDQIRQRLWRAQDDDFGPCAIVERRNIVFMREQTPTSSPPKTAAGAAEDAPAPKKKILKPAYSADFFAHTITPDEKLLFRFSALTFNAHAIHLDPHYCRTVEGHRDLLFHGPMSYTLMVTLLQRELAKRNVSERITRVEYRNLAPLYCHEPIRFCGHADGEGRYEVWAETPEGGIAVKGSVRTEQF